MDKLLVAKFCGEDWNVWKFQMEAFLDYQGLLPVVDGSLQRPEQPRHAAEWDSKDKKARMYIGLSLESAQVRQVMNLKSAHGMWSRLQSLYELKNSTSVHLLLQRFYEYRMEPGSNVATHVAKVEEMARQLEDLGHKQEEVALVTKVLHSLPASYRHLISAWDSVPSADQTMENLLPRLMKEELLSNRYSEGDSEALYGNCKKRFGDCVKNRDVRQSSISKFTGKCFYCGKAGHMRRDCSKLQDKKSEQLALVGLEPQQKVVETSKLDTQTVNVCRDVEVVEPENVPFRKLIQDEVQTELSHNVKDPGGIGTPDDNSEIGDESDKESTPDIGLCLAEEVPSDCVTEDSSKQWETAARDELVSSTDDARNLVDLPCDRPEMKTKWEICLESGPEDDKKNHHEDKSNLGNLCKVIKDILVGSAERVVSLPCCVVAGQCGWSANKRIMEDQALRDFSTMSYKAILKPLVVNPMQRAHLVRPPEVH